MTSSVIGMLDLEPRVHLHEVELAVARRGGTRRCRRSCTPRSFAAAIAASPMRRRRPSSRAAEGASSISFWWRRWIEHSRSPRWRMLPAGIAEDLELDVARALEVLLEIHLGVAERLLGLVARGFVRAGELALVAGDAHSPPAAAGRGLQDDGVTGLLRECQGLVDRVDRPRRARHRRDAGRGHRPPRERLVAHLPDGVGRRAR